MALEYDQPAVVVIKHPQLRKKREREREEEMKMRERR